jgi:chromosome segregation ATPase
LEFSVIRKKYVSATDEVERLKGSLAESEKKLSVMDSQLKHSQFIIKKLVDASRDAISEFNELRQRFANEVDRRKEIEQQYQRLLIQTEPISTARTGAQQLEDELATLRVQLRDTLMEFEQHKVR